MQVAHVQDHVTHAVIGGMQTINMKMTDDPAIFHMLASVLYSDQKLAVVREVVCNQWDAHIEAGCTDKHIEITITDDRIIFKDYGRGIPHELIGPIYGVMRYNSSASEMAACRKMIITAIEEG